jgi:hypothetical protein
VLGSDNDDGNRAWCLAAASTTALAIGTGKSEVPVQSLEVTLSHEYRPLCTCSPVHPLSYPTCIIKCLMKSEMELMHAQSKAANVNVKITLSTAGFIIFFINNFH